MVIKYFCVYKTLSLRLGTIVFDIIKRFVDTVGFPPETVPQDKVISSEPLELFAEIHLDFAVHAQRHAAHFVDWWYHYTVNHT